MTNQTTAQRVRFGVAEWIAVLAMGITPASGFAYWGMQMNTRMAVIEDRFDGQRKTLELVVHNQQQMGTNQHSIILINEQILNLQRQVDKLDKK